MKSPYPFGIDELYYVDSAGKQEEIIIPEILSLELLIAHLREFSITLLALSLSLDELSKSTQSPFNWLNVNVYLPRKFERYSWVCSGILLFSLGILFFLNLLGHQ